MIALISHLAQVIDGALDDLADSGIDVPVATVGIVVGDALYFTADPPDRWARVRNCVVGGDPVYDDQVAILPIRHDRTVAAVLVVEGGSLPRSSLQLLSRLLRAELAAARRIATLESLMHDYTATQPVEDLVTRVGPPRGGALRDLTVLFADLRGFTRFTETTASEVVASYLNEVFEPAMEVIHDHGGTVSNLMGDAILASFGALDGNDDHAYLAARAALSLTTSFADAHPDMPRFGVGVNTGRAYVGNIGGSRRRVFTIIGDFVNLAARLEGQTDPGAVTIGEETYRAIRPIADVEALDPLLLKGVHQPVTAFRLLGLDASWLSADTLDRGRDGDRQWR